MRAEKNSTAEGKKNSAAPVQSPTVVLEDSGIGDVKIHENVISSLARRATLSIEGVSRLAGSLLVDNIAEIVGSRRMQDRAIAVIFEEDNRVSLEIKLILEFGVRIPDVSGAVQRAVIEAVERHTGMTVKRVDVIVQALESPEEEAEAEAEPQPIEPVR